MCVHDLRFVITSMRWDAWGVRSGTWDTIDKRRRRFPGVRKGGKLCVSLFHSGSCSCVFALLWLHVMSSLLFILLDAIANEHHNGMACDGAAFSD